MAKLLAEIGSLDSDLAASIDAPPGSIHTEILSSCLEALTTRIMEDVDERELGSPLHKRFMSHSFKWITQEGLSSTTRAEFRARVEERMGEAEREECQHHLDVVDVCAEIGKYKDTANVWVTVRVHGMPSEQDNGVRELLGRLNWKRESIGWVSVAFEGITGLGPVQL